MNQTAFYLKHAWAALKGKPGFVSTIVVTLGFTLGALLCVLTLAYVLLFSPLPYPDQHKLYQLDHAFYDGNNEHLGNFFTYPGAVELHKTQDVFDETALVFYGESKLVSHPLRPILSTSYVTPDWFSLTGAKTELGRVFDLSEGLDSGALVSVISYENWQSNFGSDPDILGKSIAVAGSNFRIIGVLKEGFVEPQLRSASRKTDLFLPWDFNSAKGERENAWDSPHPDIGFLVRLSEGLTVSQLEQSLTSKMHEEWKEKVAGIDFFNGFNIQMQLKSFKTLILGETERTVYLLLAAVFGLVIIAVVNISNLFMSRTAEQQQQLAIKAALGANRKHIFKSLLAESGLLMVLASALALIIAQGGVFVLKEYMAHKLPRIEELSLNSFTIAAACFFVLCLAAFFAMLSSNMINYRALKLNLNSSGKGTGVQVSKNIRNLLVVGQIAIVSVLVFVNMSVFKEGVRVINQSLGFETENVYALRLSGWAETAEALVPTINELTEELESFPEVVSVSQAFSPLDVFDAVPYTPLSTNENSVVETLSIDHKYFDLLNQKVIRGRAFSKADVTDVNRVLVVNDVFAERIAPGEDVLGQRVKVGDDPQEWTVIGVVEGITIPGKVEVPARAYTTFAKDKYRLQLLVKLRDGHAPPLERIINTIDNVGGQLSFWRMQSLDKRRLELLFTQYVTAITSSILGGISYFLAAVGLYGVMSYGIQLRRLEIGTRLAIGAKRNSLVSLIVKDSFSPVLAGFVASIILLLGLYVGFAEQFASVLSFQLLGMLLMTLALVATVALISCYWPLRRYINQPPVHSLKGAG